MGSSMPLVYIFDLPENLSSLVRVFADDIGLVNVMKCLGKGGEAQLVNVLIIFR